MSPAGFRASASIVSALVIVLISLACFVATPLSSPVLANHQGPESLRARFSPAQSNSTVTATMTTYANASSSATVRSTSANTTSTATTLVTSRSTTLITTATATSAESHTSTASVNTTSSATTALTTNVTTTSIATNHTSLTTGASTTSGTNRTIYTVTNSTRTTTATNSTVRTTTYSTAPVIGTSFNETVQGSFWSYTNPAWALNATGASVANMTVTPASGNLTTAAGETNITSYQYDDGVCSGASSSGQVVVCGDVGVSTTASPDSYVSVLVSLAGTLLGGNSITTSVCNTVSVDVYAYVDGAWQSITPDEANLVSLAAGLVCQVGFSILLGWLFGTPIAIAVAAPSSTTTTTQHPTSSLTTASTSASMATSRPQKAPIAYLALAAAVAAIVVVSAVLVEMTRRKGA